MRRGLIALPLALMLMGCPPPESVSRQLAAIEADQAAKLAAAGERWRTLYEAGEWEELRTLYTDDAVLMTADQQKLVGADNIVAFLQRLSNAGATVQFRFAPEETAVESGLGFVTAKYRMDIAFSGRDPVVVAGRSFLVYKWTADGWKLWRDMDNFAPDVTPEDFE